MTAVLWVGAGFVFLIGLCHLAYLIEAISVTYQMLKGRHPNIRKGAFLGATSLLSDATIQTINYQSALEHEGALHDSDPGHHDIASID